MLVLSRKVGERLLIGRDIVIQVQKISGSQISISIEAPAHVLVDREEVRRRREAEGNDWHETPAA